MTPHDHSSDPSASRVIVPGTPVAFDVYLHGMFAVYYNPARAKLMLAAPDNPAHLMKVGTRTGPGAAGLVDMQPGRFKLKGAPDNLDFHSGMIGSNVARDLGAPDFAWNPPRTIFELPYPSLIRHYRFMEYGSPERYTGLSVPDARHLAKISVFRYFVGSNFLSRLHLEGHDWKPAVVNGPNHQPIVKLHLFNELNPAHILADEIMLSWSRIEPLILRHEDAALQDLLAMAKPGSNGGPYVRYHIKAVQPPFEESPQTQTPDPFGVSAADLSELALWPASPGDETIHGAFEAFLARKQRQQPDKPVVPSQFMMRITACEGPHFFLDE